MMIEVPAAWDASKVDLVEIAVSSGLKGMARRGEIGLPELRAAAWVRATIEAAEAGGVKAIDYGRVKVDTSLMGGGEPTAMVVSAIRLVERVRAQVGEAAFRIVRAVCFEGRSVTEVAIGWPTAKVSDAGVDTNTRKYVGRMLREALASIDEAFCGTLDPARSGVKVRGKVSPRRGGA
ncbi:hypothetical protein [Methylobrevis pamukkalensis]|nr:hypothetical protein [Methylobrevis pamukkalensis]